LGRRVFLGGGFGSHDFYAFDADTGAAVWHYPTHDDGPTAAVVQDRYVAFNTESCELEILTTDGKSVWKKWLGDPLMSMPAIHDGKVYMAYPNSNGDHQHYLACFDLRSGREYWQQVLSGEIITAPVVAERHVYVATLDGQLYRFQADDGRRVWQEKKNATSSPVVWNGQCYFSQRREVPIRQAGQPGVQQYEHLARRRPEAGAETHAYEGTVQAADYLDYLKRKMGSPEYAASEMADAAVGFAAFKGDAKISQAMLNLGKAHVHGIWAYQGSKPFISGGLLYSAQGDVLYCVEPISGEVRWQRRLQEGPAQAELLDSVLTPPALVNGKIFVGTIYGEVCCLQALSGELLWRVSVGEPIVFQPAVAGGRLYVSTNQGSLFCLETGDRDDDGWHMWGATAAHNGLPD
jgi:Ca-activated chloride channel family protein